jgi:hypothetical protein
MTRLPRLSLLTFVRLGVVAAGGTMAMLMLGPFQGLEGELGLTDKAAHAIAFYVATLGCFAALPNMRRTETGLMMLVFGASVELIQGLTGRAMSLSDFLADSVGVAAASLPAAVERWRYSLKNEAKLALESVKA